LCEENNFNCDLAPTRARHKQKKKKKTKKKKTGGWCEKKTVPPKGQDAVKRKDAR